MAKKRACKQDYQASEKLVFPKTQNQSKFIEIVESNVLTLISGPAGCGKTYLAAGLAVEHLNSKKVSKIIISRSTQQCGNSGFLPGKMEEKLAPFVHPLVSKLEHFLGADIYRKLLADKVIEIFPLETMRGETFDDCFMILTEFQNATYEQIMMFATRIGNNSKCLIEGDLEQVDNYRSGGLSFWNEQKRSENRGEGIGFVELTEDDIVRSGIVRTIIDNARIARKIKNANL